MNPVSRHLLIAFGVLMLHLGGLWALQAGLLRRAVEIVVPVALQSDIIEPQRPAIELPPPPPPPPRPPQPAARPATPPAPQPLAVAEPEPAPRPFTVVVAPLPPVGEPMSAASPPATPAAPAAALAAPAPSSAPSAPPRVDLPSSDADYLQNPKPAYPVLSRRLGEQGKVVVRVLIGVDGVAQKAEISHSSGYERLDQAALQTVLRWRYVPGKRGGVPEPMWFNVPINFVLE